MTQQTKGETPGQAGAHEAATHGRGLIKIGLTGSIAMGKSTTAALFRDAGAWVHDADAAVHRLYAPGGAAAAAITPLAPGAVREGGVDRAALKAAVQADPALLRKIEAVVHPLVAADRAAFEATAQAAGATLAVYDVPLLFETGGDAEMDAVVVVSAPAAVQRARALARPGMTEAAFEALLARQTPDAEKRARADFVIETDKGVEDARRQVAEVIAALRTRDASIEKRGDGDR